MSDSQSSNDKKSRSRARAGAILQKLQTPLQTMSGYADLLRDHLQQESLEDFADDGERIVIGTRTFADLLEEFVAVSADTDENRFTEIRHDMRNALGTVKGYSEMLVEDITEEFDDGLGHNIIVEYLGILQRESNQLLVAVDTLVRVETDEQPEAAFESEISKIFADFGQSVVRDREAMTLGDILVVDDNENNLNLLVLQLKKQGHKTRAANCGRAALEEMRASPPDLVLLDLLMPDMNGVEIMQWMRTEDELRSVPVIVITGLNDDQGLVKCIEMGAQDYLTKPINPVLLRARIDACLERRGWHHKEKEYQAELEKSYSFIRQVFGRYLSDEIVKEILDNSDGLRLGGAKRKVTLMMTDLRGFTAMSEELPAESIVQLLNNYLGIMAEIVMQYGGTVDEFIGDAILAVFGLHSDSEEDSANAVACAIAMQNAMDEVNRFNIDNDLPEIEMGIGINTGEVVVGNIGSETRSKYGVIGHHVNLAARVESFTVGGQVLISEYTHNDLSVDTEVADSMQINAKGLSEPVHVHSIQAIGGKYGLRLESGAEEWHALPKCEPLLCNLIDGKIIDSTSVACELLAISKHQLEMRCAVPFEHLANLKFSLPSAPKQSAMELYGKVARCAAEQEDGGSDAVYNIVVDITSMNSKVKAYLKDLLKE